MDTGAVYRLPLRGRHFAFDERGVALRATWHLDRGFLNLSLWRDDRCVETFHLTPVEAGRLVGFLAGGLADAVPDPVAGSPLATLHRPVAPPGDDPPPPGLSDRVGQLRRDLAEALDRAATRLRR